MDIYRLFAEHPHSIGETYLQHQRHAFAFGWTMVAAGIACMVHGMVPALFRSTGSRAITRLYDRMVLHRSGQQRSDGQSAGLLRLARAARGGVIGRP
ncbi:MAG TPA: DUF6356 family protein [Steroidobacteraceae bacterium]|nr:DUF6356 family protein [Steroidobacteraceae bacterium]